MFDHILLAIIATTLTGGLLSLACAAGTLALDRRWIGRLVAFAVGALLGAVFLEILPHALEAAPPQHVLAATLFGILLFFVLEKLVLWRHSHEPDGMPAKHPGDEHDGGRTGLMVIVGDTIHNFCDGILIAAAFLSDFNLGLVTALAIVAHEIPQEISDFVVLLHSGFSRRQAFVFNMLSSLAMVAGGIVGYAALAQMHQWVPMILALAGASLLYVAVADLIPGLHRRADLLATLQQILLILAGIGLIGVVHTVLPH